jgi:acyl-CoA thioester hydrolase
MINLDKFKFKFPLQMRWNDLDALGHVNNALFITYFEVARGLFMMEACKGWDWMKHMFLIGKVDASFHKELLLTANKAEVWMKAAAIGNKSFVLEYVVVSQKDGETVLHASGSTTQVMFDMKSRTTIEIEDWIKEGLSTY